MTDVFKVVGGLFGIGGDATPEQEVKQPIDPVEERKAMRELQGSGLLVDPGVTLPTQRESNSAVSKDGVVNFELLYTQYGLEQKGFTADQAVKMLANVEKTIPSIISSTLERNNLLRNVIVSTMSEAQTPDLLVSDAKKRSDILTNLIRNRLDMAGDFKQRAGDRIKALEEQITAARTAIDTADEQFATLSQTCKERQAQYARLADLFSQTEPNPRLDND